MDVPTRSRHLANKTPRLVGLGISWGNRALRSLALFLYVQLVRLGLKSFSPSHFLSFFWLALCWVSPVPRSQPCVSQFFGAGSLVYTLLVWLCGEREQWFVVALWVFVVDTLERSLSQLLRGSLGERDEWRRVVVRAVACDGPPWWPARIYHIWRRGTPRGLSASVDCAKFDRLEVVTA